MSDNLEILRQLAGMVAPYLGNGWRVDTDKPLDLPPSILGPGGENIYLRTEWNKPDHLIIAGAYPEGASDYPKARIGVSRFRDVSAIAGEIKRRLLPDYQESLALAQQAKRRQEQDASTRSTWATAFVQAAGGSVSEVQGDTRSTISLGTHSNWHGTARLLGDGSTVHLELSSLTASVALRVVQLVATAMPAPETDRRPD